MVTRFDLEQHIMNCWGVIEDIQTTIKITETEDWDKTQNALIGLKEIYNQKFEDLWECFETVIASRQL